MEPKKLNSKRQSMFMVHVDKAEKKVTISDKVKSLATRIQKDTQSIDWEKEKEEYLMQKYGL